MRWLINPNRSPDFSHGHTLHPGPLMLSTRSSRTCACQKRRLALTRPSITFVYCLTVPTYSASARYRCVQASVINNVFLANPWLTVETRSTASQGVPISRWSLSISNATANGEGAESLHTDRPPVSVYMWCRYGASTVRRRNVPFGQPETHLPRHADETPLLEVLYTRHRFCIERRVP